MVAEWIVALASSGSGALVGAAAEDAWGSARDGIVGLFRRAGADRQTRVGELLDADADTVETAPLEERERVRAELETAWRVRLTDFLAEFPDAAEEFAGWLAAVRAALPDPPPSGSQTNIAGRDVYAVQRGTQVFHQPGSARPDDRPDV